MEIFYKVCTEKRRGGGGGVGYFTPKFIHWNIYYRFSLLVLSSLPCIATITTRLRCLSPKINYKNACSFPCFYLTQFKLKPQYQNNFLLEIDVNTFILFDRQNNGLVVYMIVKIENICGFCVYSLDTVQLGAFEWFGCLVVKGFSVCFYIRYG